jgi:multicomponent Na+:H+ antiporter subunit G
MRPYIYDVMLIVSLLVMTLGIIGIIRMPDIYTKLHGASKSVFLGVVVLASSATVVSEQSVVYRVILLILLVVITTPIASHVIGRAAYIMDERMSSPEAIDETAKRLHRDTSSWQATRIMQRKAARTGVVDDSPSPLDKGRPTWRL